MGRTQKPAIARGLFLFGVAVLVLTSSSSAQNLVDNGDFEEGVDAFVTWPGYVGNGANPAEIPGWTGSGGRGINPVVPGGDGDAPFGNGDNSTHFAFGT